MKRLGGADGLPSGNLYCYQNREALDVSDFVQENGPETPAIKANLMPRSPTIATDVGDFLHSTRALPSDSTQGCPSQTHVLDRPLQPARHLNPCFEDGCVKSQTGRACIDSDWVHLRKRESRRQNRHNIRRQKPVTHSNRLSSLIP